MGLHVTARFANQETYMTQPVPGPAYYFPSIEKKYGRLINEWIDLIRASELTKQKSSSTGSKPNTASATDTPPH